MGTGMLRYALPFVQCFLTHASFLVQSLAAAGCVLVASFSGRVDVRVCSLSLLCLSVSLSVSLCMCVQREREGRDNR